MEKILAKIACPELDTELMENPPDIWAWHYALTPKWRNLFEKEFKSLDASSCAVPKYSSFGILFDELCSTGIGYPKDFFHYRSSAHNYAYLLREGILDELRLASIIGTTPERAAQLNGAATQEELEYYKAMKIDMPPNSNEPFNTVAGKITPESVLEQHKPWTRSQVKDLNEAVKSEVVPKLIESLKNNDMQKDPMVHHPKHYTKGDIECIDAMASVVTGLEGMEAVHTANVIKYMWRWKDKNGLQDLEKAKWYLDKLIEKVKKEK